MKHRRVRELLPWYLNETLGDAERAAVEDHLARCTSCRQSLAEWRAIEDAAAAQPQPLASSASLAMLLNRLDAMPRPAGFSRRLVLALGAVLVLLVAVLWMPNAQLKLEWTAGQVDQVDTFAIYRSQSAIQPEELVHSATPAALVDNGGFAYVDPTVRPNTPYYYWLEARDQSGAVTMAGPIRAVTDGTLFLAKLVVVVCLLGAIAVTLWFLRNELGASPLFSH